MSATQTKAAIYDHAKAQKDVGWLGQIVKIHDLGRYNLVEYVDKRSGQTFYSGVIDGRSTSNSYETIEEGIVGCIAIAAEGPNTRADRYFFRMLDRDPA